MDFLWWLFILTGILLRVRQYLVDRSLWADEASLGYNLVNRNFAELTQLLDYHQAAPIGFLFIEKSLLVLFGNTEYVLRFFPLVSGLLATYLIYRIAREHLGAAGLFAVLVFSISFWLVYYATELKQYSSDMLVALLLVYLDGNCLKETVRGKDFILLGFFGAISIWVSHPSVFILAGIGMVLVLEKISRKDFALFPWILGLGLVWVASFGLEYFVSLQNIIADEYLTEYWQKAYVPLPPWSDLSWFVKTFNSFLYLSFYTSNRTVAVLFIALVSIGALSLLIRNWRIALLVIMPFVVVAIVSALHRYPLVFRFMLFLTPFALLLMAEGLRGIYWLVSKWNRGAAVVVSLIPALIVVRLIAPATWNNFINPGLEQIQPALAYIAENRLPDDTIYVFHATDPAFNYYAPMFGLDKGNVIIGFDTPRKRIALQGFYEDVDSLIGQERVWFIFSELTDCDTCTGEGTQAFYVEYLDSVGTMQDSFDGSGGNAYLYDLSP